MEEGKLLAASCSAPAWIEAGGGPRHSFADLHACMEQWEEALAPIPKDQLLLLLAGEDFGSAACLHACLAQGRPLLLLDADTRFLAAYLQRYKPAAVMASRPLERQDYVAGNACIADLRLFSVAEPDDCTADVNPLNALMLATSGSTGSPRLVRLSHANLYANARVIADYLGLGADDRALYSLPIHYAFGLSVLNSHWLVGASILHSQHSFLRPEYWEEARSEQATSFAGVPFHYESLERLKYDPFASVKTCTQAGGPLAKELAVCCFERAEVAGGRFYLMYGQTEATARMSYLEPEARLGREDSIGRAIPGGRFELSGAGELLYHGPNVMLGYAEGPEDLRLGDCLEGVLETGDLAEVDAEGYYYVRGRRSRFAKVFGKRMQLDDVERLASVRAEGVVAAIEQAGKLLLFSETALDPTLRHELAAELALPPAALRCKLLDALPRNARGKIDYPHLATLYLHDDA